ncbi:MAG: Sec-independent protein translocase protein TatA [bacterium]|nr:Sec-independent protein translocase protein TatA [bacterium]
MPLGPTELIIILVIVLIVFGAGRLPDVLRSMGQGVRAFKDEVRTDDKSAPSEDSARTER